MKIFIRKPTVAKPGDKQFNQGERYRNGEGVAIDYGKAAAWYRKAARQNHAMAQSNLGVLYEKGLGVP